MTMPEVIDKKPSRSKSGKSLSYSKKQYLDWYEIILRIRRFEERTLMMYSKQKIRGFCHVYIGQEAIAAGLTSAITSEDCVITAYRQHGIAISRGISTAECMAELFGKSTGIVGGKGGSMHFFSKEKRFFGGNGIVGAQIPIGTGIAFAEKYRKSSNLCVTMFGDGAARQGALYESFNMAMSWSLPVLFLCENNGYAMGTSVKRTSNVTELSKIGLAFDMPSESVDGMSPESVHEALSRAANHIRSGKGPYYLEIKTYRYRGHSVSDPAKYRTKEELNHYKDQDPLLIVQSKLKELKVSDKVFQDLEQKVKIEIDQAIEFAENSPFPGPEELYTDNYMQKDYPFLKD